MTRYLARRLVYLVVQVLLVATIVFLLLRLVPGDPAMAVLGETASQEQIEAMRHKLGIDQPFVVQYASWLGGVVQGNLGQSIINGAPVQEQVAQRIRKVLKHIDAERVTLTTDCGLKQLPRTCAIQKLRALVEGARIVRRELR